MKGIAKACIAALLIAGCVCSCKKSSTSPIDPQITLLTSGTWKISKLEFQTASGTWTSVAVPAAQASETISFNRDNTYFGSTTGNSFSGNWKFSADYSQLYLVNSSTSNSATFLMNALTASTLEFTLSGATVVYGTSYYAERDTYTH